MIPKAVPTVAQPVTVTVTVGTTPTAAPVARPMARRPIARPVVQRPSSGSTVAAVISGVAQVIGAARQAIARPRTTGYGPMGVPVTRPIGCYPVMPPVAVGMPMMEAVPVGVPLTGYGIPGVQAPDTIPVVRHPQKIPANRYQPTPTEPAFTPNTPQPEWHDGAGTDWEPQPEEYHEPICEPEAECLPDDSTNPECIDVCQPEELTEDELVCEAQDSDDCGDERQDHTADESECGGAWDEMVIDESDCDPEPTGCEEFSDATDSDWAGGGFDQSTDFGFDQSAYG